MIIATIRHTEGQRVTDCHGMVAGALVSMVPVSASAGVLG